ncbi:restriction endonuclease subunit S [Acidithrix sp. C25]|uniref:restriction endonuclease subunit S n=1 Tax=Acidithrix sp. C25 TaxID=1671482 RepID=UPI00191B8FE0|nr:restriction endonuclease subunit S [Acidithrix sp. C25]CAG4902328.1 unnamed protein product [Acidithrix sp. C25]
MLSGVALRPVLENWLKFRNGKSSPRRTDDGAFPVYGSNGIIGRSAVSNVSEQCIVIGRVGSYCGSCYFVPSACWVTDNAIICQPEDPAETRYWYYVLSSLNLNDRRVGSGQPLLNQSILNSIEFDAPAKSDRLAISATLGALDDKIESNRRQIAVMEELLSLEFQNLQVKESVQRLPLSQLTIITKGVSYRSADLKASRTSLVTLKSFARTGGYKPEGLKPYSGPYKLSQVIKPGEVVIAQTDLTQGAEVVGRAVRVPSDHTADTLVASLDLAIIRPTDVISNEYLLGILTDETFRQYCRSRTSGTTVLHLSGDAIPTYLAPMVSADAQERFAKLARPLVARTDSLGREVVELSNIRDVLLPELLSGRIRVSEAQETVA